MFFKQLVRCPYLYESEEFKLFTRPAQGVEKSLTFLPKLNNQRLLEKISPFYSIMGDIDHKQLQDINLSVNAFCAQCRNNLSFLERFRKQVLEMESGFDAGWGCNAKLNHFFYRYESEVLASHLISLHKKDKQQQGPKSPIEGADAAA